jgi:hypothetical protein
MRLVEDWKWIVLKGWQFRANILAAIFSALEVWFALINPYTLPSWIPPGAFAVLAMVTTLLANIFRLIAQVRGIPKNADQS